MSLLKRPIDVFLPVNARGATSRPRSGRYNTFGAGFSSLPPIRVVAEGMREVEKPGRGAGLLLFRSPPRSKRAAAGRAALSMRESIVL
jgi:hypothetical protein